MHLAAEEFEIQEDEEIKQLKESWMICRSILEAGSWTKSIRKYSKSVCKETYFHFIKSEHRAVLTDLHLTKHVRTS